MPAVTSVTDILSVESFQILGCLLGLYFKPPLGWVCLAAAGSQMGSSLQRRNSKSLGKHSSTFTYVHICIFINTHNLLYYICIYKTKKIYVCILSGVSFYLRKEKDLKLLSSFPWPVPFNLFPIWV